MHDYQPPRRRSTGSLTSQTGRRPTQPRENRRSISPPNAPLLRTVPLPPILHAGPAIHPALPFAAHPGIKWDIRQPPSHALVEFARLEWAFEAATSPPMRTIILICAILHGPIVVSPLHQDYDYVTVRDVLLAVHQAYSASQLHADVSPTEEERYVSTGPDRRCNHHV